MRRAKPPLALLAVDFADGVARFIHGRNRAAKRFRLFARIFSRRLRFHDCTRLSAGSAIVLPFDGDDRKWSAILNLDDLASVLFHRFVTNDGTYPITPIVALSRAGRSKDTPV